MYSPAIQSTIERLRVCWRGGGERVLSGATKRTNCSAWGAGGTELATAASDGGVRVYDVARGAATAHVRANADAAVAVCWAPGGRAQTLAAVGSEPVLALVDVRTRGVAARVAGVGACTAVAWAARESVACRDADGVLRVVDVRAGAVARRVADYDVKDVAADAAGSTLYCATAKGTVALLAAARAFAPGAARTVRVSTASVRCCAWRAGCLAVGGADHTYAVWDTRDWVCRAAFGSQEASIRAVSLGPSRSLLAPSAVGSSSAVNDLPKGTTGTITSSSSSMTTTTTTPTTGTSNEADAALGTMLVAAGADGAAVEGRMHVDIGHAESGACVCRRPVPAATVHLAWSPTRPLLAWCGRNLETVSLFSPASSSPSPVAVLSPSPARH